ncbi:MAG: FeoB-associated Cys-rich membrane protein [Bacteroidales bacterium]|nr:FeoB-associated Cys-rich membrane protein [Bacteroidales bacterium]
MTQKFIVILIILVTALFVARWIVRQIKGDSGCGCSDCPLKGKTDCHCEKKE